MCWTGVQGKRDVLDRGTGDRDVLDRGTGDRDVLDRLGVWGIGMFKEGWRGKEEERPEISFVLTWGVVTLETFC